MLFTLVNECIEKTWAKIAKRYNFGGGGRIRQILSLITKNCSEDGKEGRGKGNIESREAARPITAAGLRDCRLQIADQQPVRLSRNYFSPDFGITTPHRRRQSEQSALLQHRKAGAAESQPNICQNILDEFCIYCLQLDKNA